MANVMNPFAQPQQQPQALAGHDHASAPPHVHNPDGTVSFTGGGGGGMAGMGAMQPYTVVQTAHGPVQVPYVPGRGLGQQTTVVVPGSGIKIGTVLVVGAGLVFLGNWAYKKWFKGRGDGGGRSHRSAHEGSEASEASEGHADERGRFEHRREAKRSRSRLMAEFQRFLETNAEEE